MGYVGRFDRAFAFLAELKRRVPTYPNLKPETAFVQLLSGDLRPEVYRDLRGGRDGRPRVNGMQAFDRAGIPLWTGEPIPGKRLLLWTWGGFGFGDVIQMARLIPAIKAHSGAHVTLATTPGFSRLFHRLPGLDVLTEQPSVSLEGVDYHCPAEWLPVVCSLTEAILQGCPYLTAEPERVEQWAPTFADKTVVHLGLHWIPDLAGHANAKWRVCSLDDLAPLFAVPRARWYSLQLGGGEALKAYPQITDLGQADRADAKFVHTAAILTHLDAVVCIDSAIGHLAGASGRPVFMLLGALADPQWGANQSGPARWYPQTRIRQIPIEARRDADAWEALVTSVRDELAEGFVPMALRHPEAVGRQQDLGAPRDGGLTRTCP
jgi:Glycosyltransferase family 9 (heptosyltransferase)